MPQLATARLQNAAQHSLKTVQRALSVVEIQHLAPVAMTAALVAVTLVASAVLLVTATTVVQTVVASAVHLATATTVALAHLVVPVAMTVLPVK